MKFRTYHRWLCVSGAGIGLATGTAGSARSVPTIDTEDATLGSASVAATGGVHVLLGLDVRNGDYARAGYDDDRADLSRLPVHAQLGVAVDLSHGADGTATGWLVLRSSNGFHAPTTGETGPRFWYESNTLAAIVLTPARGLRAAAVYTIKTSPNRVSGTTHEASLSFAYDGHDGLGMLSPTFAVTMRPRGDHGLFAQAAIEPGVDLSPGGDGARLSLPIAVGTGRRGFYGAGTGNRRYLSAGMAVEQPFRLGVTHWSMRFEALALVRDNRLAALSRPMGEGGTVVPLVTWSVSIAY